ncbi:porin [Psychromonas hadalis]|uniref:porin n=1 Tax=Psychromonas hadalis TaxID=211669 RepID=UPI0003B306D7|nr:porin [Psychromonas hadalis]
MKKTLLAITIPALFIANSVSATELYSDEVNTFSVGGHISAGLTGSDEGDTGVNSVAPRINFGATRDLGNGFTADALVEWSINMEGGEQALSTRLGYLGLAHDVYGRAAIGTQWAPTFDVTGVADMPIAFANDFLYSSDMGSAGTARADDMVSYRNSFDFSDNMSLNLGLGWQGVQEDYDARYQVALSFDFAKFSVGVAYNTGDVEYTTNTETATMANVSAKYGSYGQGLYVAAVYGQNDWVYRSGSENAYEETTDAEFIVAYAFANSINVSLNYESSTDEKKSETLYSQSALQVEYNFLPNVVGYVGYQVDLGNDINVAEDNIWMIGGRIYL